ncbi:cytochrome PufQ [Pseudaestuariivita rosea]|uniref:cytochrome PufQ n=1 Tax=Pseudaestuariivita rosea TaxID=2763263 RepID=UPI001ABB1201|nr:cytochrome PufQ [Pseudaestuariivita rosea]
MTDFTSDTPIHKVHKTPRTEFYVYFTIIFLAALPLAAISWMLSMIKQRQWSSRGPVARAITQARIITPMIFAA